MSKLQNFQSQRMGIITEEQLKEIFEDFLASKGLKVKLQVYAYAGEQNKLAVKVVSPKSFKDEQLDILEELNFDEDDNEEDMEENEPSASQTYFGDDLFEACFGDDAKYFLDPIYAGNELINQITVAMSEERYLLYHLSS